MIEENNMSLMYSDFEQIKIDKKTYNKVNYKVV